MKVAVVEQEQQESKEDPEGHVAILTVDNTWSHHSLATLTPEEFSHRNLHCAAVDWGKYALV